MKSNLILILLGVLICAKASAFFTPSAITLTKDNHIVFSGPVDDESVAKAEVELGQLSSKLPKSAVIYLVIDSPGGSVTAGNSFIDFARALPQTIRPICIFCASMGYHMFQSFDQRIVQNSSSLMSHRARLGGLSGQVPGELETRLKSIKDILDEMDANVAKRVGTSVEAYRKLIHDELWLSGAQAIKLKHADALLKVGCSPDLMAGTKEQKVVTLFGPVDVTLSTCPLINGILKFKFSRSGRHPSYRTESLIKNAVLKTKRTVKWSF
jgi:ATP-dependent protease ClpP protease subunit